MNTLLSSDIQNILVMLSHADVIKISARYLKMRKYKWMLNKEFINKNCCLYLMQLVKQEFYLYHKIFGMHEREFFRDLKLLVRNRNARGIFCCYVYSFLKDFFRDVEYCGVRVVVSEIEKDMVVGRYGEEGEGIDSLSDEGLCNVARVLIVKSIGQIYFVEDDGVDQVIEL